MPQHPCSCLFTTPTVCSDFFFGIVKAKSWIKVFSPRITLGSPLHMCGDVFLSMGLPPPSQQVHEENHRPLAFACLVVWSNTMNFFLSCLFSVNPAAFSKQ